MRRINSCLNAQLETLCQRVIQLDEMNKIVSTYLPETFREYCQVGSFNKGCLVLLVKNSALASQLRYSLPEIRNKLRTEAHIYQLTSIKITIEVEQFNAPLKKTNPPFLSDIARNSIVTTANQCHYTPLKEALYHLASCGGSDRND
ncbi:DUF721 domain-containing protein [Legionella oakridgensis]|uniref:DUF721 domain-containing protein n=2 Tax=Legionella oakridgensis TaxID=29423 RepID=W0BBZ9_9GAMM|nr:DUF721 domain-containing protein [Legionella oakridgensis]AHE66152.1 hypothetical protein Loa_00582 [Legionella oakridgensis ATCC 33761 = DSM 21215]ETO94017.1 hypothetical protein LOR_52c10170 [Legionella oakridgensis RV-2-2007]KTD43895.1 hypothetical protein Loak_0445 [Legionella oakridgensis]STY16063.1 Zn-ribbon-containing, possible RNA-binding protein-like protein [Legionella longbeachae]